MSRTPRILLVDDNMEILELTALVLGGEGFEVVPARNGVDALDRLTGESFDLVLLDINMPDMDGWETLRHIRADELLDGLPVVMFSVKGEFVDKIQGMQEGALDYVTKPFRADDLVARVRRALTASPPDVPGPGSPLVPRA